MCQKELRRPAANAAPCAAASHNPACEEIWDSTAVVAIVIAVIPVPLGVPAMLIFVPPATVGSPASFPGLVQFMTSVFGLLALAAMMFDGFVELVVSVGDAPLAIIILSMHAGCCGEHEKARQCHCRQGGFAKQQIDQSISHIPGPPGELLHLLQNDLSSYSFYWLG
jgi:hypothetical protein